MQTQMIKLLKETADASDETSPAEINTFMVDINGEILLRNTNRIRTYKTKH